jgi:hypothetical protein
MFPTPHYEPDCGSRMYEYSYSMYGILYVRLNRYMAPPIRPPPSPHFRSPAQDLQRSITYICASDNGPPG